MRLESRTRGRFENPGRAGGQGLFAENLEIESVGNFFVIRPLAFVLRQARGSLARCLSIALLQFELLLAPLVAAQRLAIVLDMFLEGIASDRHNLIYIAIRGLDPSG